MVTISNERLEVKINLHGGSLTSIFDKQRKMEMQYQPDPRAWKGQDVVIFPFVARLKDKTFTYKGKEYSLDNHGLARYNDFDVVYQKDNEVTLLFKSTKETLKKYPFEFKLFVNYKVVDEVLFVKYSVKSNGDIYYGLGGHPALRIPAVENEDCLDTSGNRVVLDKEYDLYYYSMDSNYEFVDRKKTFWKSINI
jgi:galactose mutarotase-like enzyme